MDAASVAMHMASVQTITTGLRRTVIRLPVGGVHHMARLSNG